MELCRSTLRRRREWTTSGCSKRALVQTGSILFPHGSRALAFTSFIRSILVPHRRALRCMSLSPASFRGIGSGRSRVAFNSKVVVRKGARGTDSFQSLRGLLAGAGAEIDVRPQLEIYTDDVRC